MLNAGANQAEACNARSRSGGNRFVCYSEHSGTFKGLVKHGPISWFKYVEGKEVVWKEHGLG